MLGKVIMYVVIIYGRVNVRVRVFKGVFLWLGLFYEEKKIVVKIKIFELYGFFFLKYIVV